MSHFVRRGSAVWSEQAHICPIAGPYPGPFLDLPLQLRRRLTPRHFLKQGRMPSSSQAYSPLMMLFERR